MKTAKALAALFADDERRAGSLGRIAGTAAKVFRALRERPLLTLRQVAATTGVTFPSAGKGMEALVRLGVARELTGRRRDRVFAYDRYLALLNEGTETG